MVNPLDAADEAIVCVNGHFSERMAVIASRTPAKIHRVEAPLGRTVDPEEVRRMGKGRKIKFIGVCHGETSTGVISPLDDFRKVADELGTMLVVDAVATLVGTPLNVDQQRIDLCFSGSQKAIALRQVWRRSPSAPAWKRRCAIAKRLCRAGISISPRP